MAPRIGRLCERRVAGHTTSPSNRLNFAFRKALLLRKELKATETAPENWDVLRCVPSFPLFPRGKREKTQGRGGAETAEPRRSRLGSELPWPPPLLRPPQIRHGRRKLIGGSTSSRRLSCMSGGMSGIMRLASRLIIAAQDTNPFARNPKYRKFPTESPIASTYRRFLLGMKVKNTNYDKVLRPMVPQP